MLASARSHVVTGQPRQRSTASPITRRRKEEPGRLEHAEESVPGQAGQMSGLRVPGGRPHDDHHARTTISAATVARVSSSRGRAGQRPGTRHLRLSRGGHDHDHANEAEERADHVIAVASEAVGDHAPGQAADDERPAKGSQAPPISATAASRDSRMSGPPSCGGASQPAVLTAGEPPAIAAPHRSPACRASAARRSRSGWPRARPARGPRARAAACPRCPGPLVHEVGASGTQATSG